MVQVADRFQASALYNNFVGNGSRWEMWQNGWWRRMGADVRAGGGVDGVISRECCFRWAASIVLTSCVCVVACVCVHIWQLTHNLSHNVACFSPPYWPPYHALTLLYRARVLSRTEGKHCNVKPTEQAPRPTRLVHHANGSHLLQRQPLSNSDGVGGIGGLICVCVCLHIQTRTNMHTHAVPVRVKQALVSTKTETNFGVEF